MAETFIKNKHYEKMREILTYKGYDVYDTSELNGAKASYSLRVTGYFGFGCGTGLKWHDYLQVPAYYSVTLTGVDVKIEKSRHFTGPVGSKARARRKLMKTIRNFPLCDRNS